MTRHVLRMTLLQITKRFNVGYLHEKFVLLQFARYLNVYCKMGQNAILHCTIFIGDMHHQGNGTSDMISLKLLVSQVQYLLLSDLLTSCYLNNIITAFSHSSSSCHCMHKHRHTVWCDFTRLTKQNFRTVSM